MTADVVHGPSEGRERPLHRFFAADHQRLDGLLTRSVTGSGPVDLETFGAFRAGILRHIEANLDRARRQWVEADEPGR